MRSNNNYRYNRGGDSDRAWAYADSKYRSRADDNHAYNNYGNYDYDYDGDRNANRSEANRYSNYEGNYGRGNYENNSDGYGSDYRNYNNRRRSSYSSHTKNWDSEEPGYYSRYNQENDRGYASYGNRRQGENEWSGGDGRNYASEYNDQGYYNRYDDDRGFFGRMGDRLRSAWHQVTDRDDTRDNMRRLKQRDRGYSSGYDHSDYNRGNYRPYPRGSSDSGYNHGWNDNSHTVYGRNRQNYGSYAANRDDLTW